jgi:TorA maturation chaperone TorD/NAD-dependent dihydropyrimidine dehydrogenase PreA subunit
MVVQGLSALYSGLARALAVETAWPEWLCKPGKEWPLWSPAVCLAAQDQWPGMGDVVHALAEVPAASPEKRQAAFEALLFGNGGPPICLYESHYLNGRLLGPEMRAVESLYRQVGLELQGAELPDHAAVELEFLAFLSEHEANDAEHSRDWRLARQRFTKEHAGRWLPSVGRYLSQSADPAWAVIGGMLVVLSSPPRRKGGSTNACGLPAVARADDCSLCGFCVQVCPTQALWIAEDQETSQLQLAPASCVRCRKCERICDSQALKLNDLNDRGRSAAPIVLRQSPRAVCPGCGSATVSQAELVAIVDRLGHHPAWLDYCLDCRVLHQFWN